MISRAKLSLFGVVLVGPAGRMAGGAKLWWELPARGREALSLSIRAPRTSREARWNKLEESV
jgi:hypothetical protein